MTDPKADPAALLERWIDGLAPIDLWRVAQPILWQMHKDCVSTDTQAGVLDIVFKLEKAFNIKIPRGEMFPEDIFTNQAFVQNGRFTPEVAFELLQRHAALVRSPAGRVVTLTLNRPETRNALSADVVDALEDSLLDVHQMLLQDEALVESVLRDPATSSLDDRHKALFAFLDRVSHALEIEVNESIRSGKARQAVAGFGAAHARPPVPASRTHPRPAARRCPSTAAGPRSSADRKAHG